MKVTDIEYFIKHHPDSTPDMYVIETTVCRSLGITRQMLRSNSRKQDYVIARYLCFTFAKINNLRGSLKNIGSLYGKDHATVLHGIQEVKDRVDTDKGFRKLYKELEITLG